LKTTLEVLVGTVLLLQEEEVFQVLGELAIQTLGPLALKVQLVLLPEFSFSITNWSLDSFLFSVVFFLSFFFSNFFKVLASNPTIVFSPFFSGFNFSLLILLLVFPN
jgi:hypothetical protein